MTYPLWNAALYRRCLGGLGADKNYAYAYESS